MKKLTAVFLALIFAYTGFSQGLFRIHAGPAFNYLKAQGEGQFTKVHTGFTMGVGYEMIASKNFSVQPEFNYMHLSTEETVTNSEIKFDYVQVPVLLKGVNDKRTFSAYVGPQLGFLTKASLRSAGKTTDIKDQLTQTDFSGILGIEFVTSPDITINLRYVQGFSNVYKAEFDSDNKTRHQIVVLTVGYIFKKKK